MIFAPPTTLTADGLILRGDRTSGYELLQLDPSGVESLGRFTDVATIWAAVDRIDLVGVSDR